MDGRYRPPKEKIILGANRVAENSDEIARKTYIITRDVIQRNGWSTLLDVLRTLPEFQVSEPSNALLGEAFLMRGMLGNLYTKILINGVPILPSAAPGMPLGGNLPIKQAERIEIVLGPATTVYGNDALAGIINIVVAEVERPVEAKASLAVGAPGLDEFHLLLGGKAGGSKHVLQYQLFGSSRQMKDRNLLYGDTLLRVDSNLVRNNPNWVGQPMSELPRVEDQPHQSRILGATLQMAGLRLSGIKMFRKDQSSLAQSPLEVAYSDPNTFISDDIVNLQLQYDKTLGKFWIHTNLSYLDYKIDNQSSYVGVDHPVSNGRNFMHAASQDFLAEQLANFKARHWSILMGGNYIRRNGEAFQSYLSHPFDDRSVSFDSLANADVVENATSPTSHIGPKSAFHTYHYHDFGCFSQLNVRFDRFNLVAAARYDRQNRKAQFSWRAGGFFKVTNGFRLRGVVSRAYRAPGTFYRFNNYRYFAAPGELEANYKREEVALTAETIFNTEFGIILLPSKKLRFELSGFRYRLSNSIYFDQNFPNDSTGATANLYLGYKNANSSSILQTVQAIATLDLGWFKANVAGLVNTGSETIDGIDTLDHYRSVPSYQVNADLHFIKEKWFHFAIYGRLLGDIDNYYFSTINQEIVSRSVAGFYNVDATLGRTFAKRIFVYVRVKNLTNSISRGITTNFISTRQLAYIPQEKRYLILGVNFNL